MVNEVFDSESLNNTTCIPHINTICSESNYNNSISI